MDPTQALTDIRNLTQQIETRRGKNLAETGVELAEKVEDLDEWMSRGGFPPEQWQRPNGRPRLKEEGPVLEGVVHGKRRSYNEGCRCTLCRAANRLRRNLSPAEIKEISNASQQR